MGFDNECISPAKYTSFAINICLHVMILFAILSCLFHFLISRVEKSTINGQLTDSINKLADNITNDKQFQSYLYGGTQEQIADKLRNMYAYPDETVTENNSWLMKVTIIANIAVFIIVVSIILLLIFNCKECIPIGHILAENAGTFTLVGIIEVLFFLNVAMQYIPIHPDIVSKTFLSELLNKL